MTRRITTTATFVCLVGLSSCSTCQGGGGLQIQNRPSFQLTFVDNNGAVQVQFSDDGLSWTNGGLTATAAGGVGASSSPDVAGLTRLVADGGPNSRLRLWFGLGPSTWDANPVSLPTLRPAARPTIVDAGSSRYLIAFLPPNSTSFELWLYDHSARQPTQIPVSAGYGNDGLHASPAMAFLPADAAAGRNYDRVALAWGRYQNANSTEPYEIRTLYAAISPQGQVGVGGGFFVIKSDSLDSFTYFGPIPHLLSEPALAHDHTKFFLASHQRFYGVQPTTRKAEYVRIHTSTDGQNWTTRTWLEFNSTRVQDDPGRVEFALQPDCRAVLIIVPMAGDPPHAQMYPLTGPVQAVPNAQIFGAALPSARQFTLMSTGKPSYVPPGGCNQY
jgi:hypothetical protein